MLTLYCWNDSHQGGWLSPAEVRANPALLAEAHLAWIDLSAPTPDEEEWVFRSLAPVHPLTLEDATRLRRDPEGPPHFPKVEEFEDYLFVIVNPLLPGYLGRLQHQGQAAGPLAAHGHVRATTQLSVVLTERVLVTHHPEPLDATENLRRYLSKHENRSDRGPDFFFHLVLDAMVDEYAPILDYFDESLDALEEQVLRRPQRVVLSRLLQLKQDIIRLRKTLVYEREILARLSRGEFALIDDQETVYYRNVYDHLVRFAELIEGSREMASDLMQTHLSALSNRLNEVMKTLTMISTVVLPMTLVAGIYGMNFEFMPELKKPWGYPFALGLMAATGLLSFAYFRRKKWI